MATCEWQLASDEWRRRDRHAADRQHQQHANDVTRRDTRALLAAQHSTALILQRRPHFTSAILFFRLCVSRRVSSPPVSSRLVSSLSSLSRPPSRPAPSAPSHRHFASPARAHNMWPPATPSDSEAPRWTQPLTALVMLALAAQRTPPPRTPTAEAAAAATQPLPALSSSASSLRSKTDAERVAADGCSATAAMSESAGGERRSACALQAPGSRRRV